MPYKSKSQQRAFHAKAARGEISAETVKHWDEATKRAPGGFKSLPEKILTGHTKKAFWAGFTKRAMYMTPADVSATTPAVNARGQGANKAMVDQATGDGEQG